MDSPPFPERRVEHRRALRHRRLAQGIGVSRRHRRPASAPRHRNAAWQSTTFLVRGSAPPQPGQVAQVVGIRVESSAESQKSRKLMGAVAAGILTCVVGMVIFRDATAGSRARFFGNRHRLALPFTAADDYESVVGRIGYPDSTRSRPSPDGSVFYLLRYPDRGFTVVLLGPERAQASYIGAIGRGGRVIHSVTLPDGRNSAALLAPLNCEHPLAALHIHFRQHHQSRDEKDNQR